MRYLISALTSLFLLLSATQIQASNFLKPPIFDTSFAHWDHHWFVWLPSHPTYEAVEVMERTRAGNEPIVWVFFTERAGPKKQIHYFNDADTAANFGNGAHYVDLNYQRSGAANLAQSISLNFVNELNQNIEIDVESNNGPLWPGGLTNQSGHSLDRLFLIFFREKSALAQQNRITIDGEDFSFNDDADSPFPLPFKAAYSANLYTGTINYSDLDYSWCWRHLIGENGEVYKAKANQKGVYTSDSDPMGSVKEYQWHGKRLLNFTHSLGQHKMVFDFAEGINFRGHESQGTFAISLDDFEDLITGNAAVERTAWNSWVMRLSPTAPEWGSQTTLIFNIEMDWHGYRIISSHERVQ